MTVSCVFLFNADEKMAGHCYGDYYDRHLFAKTVQLTELNSINTCVLFGDLLLRSVCRRISEVSQTPDGRSMTRTYHVDKELYVTLACDLAETLGEQWSTLDIEQLPLTICSKNIHCVAFTSISLEECQHIDIGIKSIPGYLGAAIIDSGNPLHYQLFWGLLIYPLFIKNGGFFYQAESRLGSILRNIASTTPVDIYPLSEFDFFEQRIPVPQPSATSPRGAFTRRILEVRATLSHKERVALSLSTQPGRGLRFIVPEGTKHEQVKILENKITGYVLNHNHNEGKHKAKLFKELLDIDTKDWRFLASQIIDGLPTTDVHRVRMTEHGVQYHADMQILGINSNSRTVRTGWIVVGEEPPRLTTAYICGLDEQREGEGVMPGYVYKDNMEIQEWYEAVLSLALARGRDAATNEIPTPMFISGFGEKTIQVPGICGNASVVIPDARKGFARWLRTNNIGSANYKGGWQISAMTDDQTLDRAEAYARAVAKVLQSHGIHCNVRTYID